MYISFVYLRTDPDLCGFTFFQALPILVEVIKQAPAFDIAYYYLSRVSEQLGKTESSSTEALKIAANIKGSKSPFWKLLYERFK
jgi:general transcription factor 3C polypeptide 3 (transcription factor C subunit 4)